MMAENSIKVRCGECRYFAREGQCDFLKSEAGRAPDRPFAHAPFWVWSDCFSDKEQVRSNVWTLCPTFEPIAVSAMLAERERQP